ncbi:FG-GAP-like repeat-containing protein [Taibaiella helva]|uniref:FG-GAP-like repeat-containing protein n=1 Tax=Taibaiella helva TaxID=2301235 RepID=UPI0018E58241|nr:FG-GAP-like repeat-containing protein [Taibaiella helva]
MKSTSILLLSLVLSLSAGAQQFSVIDSLPIGAYGTAAWGDYDGDGRKDLVYIAQTMTEGQPDIFRIYHNTASGMIGVADMGFLFNPAAHWADLDNDGKDDLLVSGFAADTFAPVFRIYKSNGNGSFLLVNDTLKRLAEGGIDVADYNGDGLKDIAASGTDTAGEPYSLIWRNEGGFRFSDIGAGLAGIRGGELKWQDYDGDGKSDLAMNGVNWNASRTYIYHNEGNDSFRLASPYMKGGFGTVDWLDYDADTHPDLLVTGVDSAGQHNFVGLYRNNGDGTFSQVNTNLPAFGEPSAVDIADFDRDGKPDICFGGGNDTFFSFSAMAFGNTTPAFDRMGSFRQMDVTNCIVAAADIDNDGDSDLLFSNFLLRNDGPASIGSHELPGVVVYPNPVRKLLLLQHSEPDDVALILSDISGKVVYQGKAPSGIHMLDISGYAPGIYQLFMRSGERQSVKRLVFTGR